MSNTYQVKNEKKVVSHGEFEKRVEIEAAHLVYFNYMKKHEAFNEARKYIASKFMVNHM